MKTNANKIERQKRELRELIAENTVTVGMSENMFDSHEEYRLNHAEAAQNLRLYRAELAALEPTA